MSIININKPSSSMINSNRIGIGETWDSILTTWATESRTWDAMASIIGNITKISSSITNISRPA